MAVDLGFAEKCESWRLSSRFFPSKIGGKPAWLDLKNIPGTKDLECDYCGEPCIFLCQVYAPHEENAYAFHRTVYVFICRNPKCCKPNENGNLKVFRSQLERRNGFFPYEPPIEQENWGTDIDAKHWVKTCNICGILAPSQCSRCKTINYCSRLHQIYDWKHDHKKLCGSNISSKHMELLFPEYEVVIETDDTVQNTMDKDAHEEKEMKKYEKMIQNGEAGTLQNENMTLLDMDNGEEEDETFQHFCVKTEKYPDQIIRYDRGGKVLYMSADNQVHEIPKCLQCNGERQFEFQIMPQLLNFLDLKDSFDCIDWGILAIFTCKQSCTTENNYIAEYVWKQDIENKKS